MDDNIHEDVILDVIKRFGFEVIAQKFFKKCTLQLVNKQEQMIIHANTVRKNLIDDIENKNQLYLDIFNKSVTLWFPVVGVPINKPSLFYELENICHSCERKQRLRRNTQNQSWWKQKIKEKKKKEILCKR